MQRHEKDYRRREQQQQHQPYRTREHEGRALRRFRAQEFANRREGTLRDLFLFFGKFYLLLLYWCCRLE